MNRGMKFARGTGFPSYRGKVWDFLHVSSLKSELISSSIKREVGLGKSSASYNNRLNQSIAMSSQMGLEI